MTINELPTPVLLLDIDLFEGNVRRMASHVTGAGKRFRPHAKAHKCVEIARRQIAAGAVGVCAATVSEAELLVHAGIADVLLTSPVADPLKCRRIAALAPHAAAVVDHAGQVTLYADAAREAGVRLNVLVDVDVGDHRTGIAPGDAAFRLAQQISACASLQFAGLQAYSVRASHIEDADEREEYTNAVLRPLLETRALLERAGISVPVMTGGSTGSFEADCSAPHLTEIQAGSYALMDLAYRRIGIGFAHAMTVLATVISANHKDRVTVDAGFKAFSTDRKFGPELLDGRRGRYEWAGDEFGYVFGAVLRLGDRVRFLPPHCDPTVNLYDCIHVCRGDSVVDVWPVMNRVARGAAGIT